MALLLSRLVLGFLLVATQPQATGIAWIIVQSEATRPVAVIIEVDGRPFHRFVAKTADVFPPIVANIRAPLPVGRHIVVVRSSVQPKPDTLRLNLRREAWVTVFIRDHWFRLGVEYRAPMLI